MPSIKQQKRGRGARAPKPSNLERRARRIIDGHDYDGATREAIRYALEDKDPDLSELVRRAERGDEIWDIAAVQRRQEQAAAETIRFINDIELVPTFLYQAMIEAIDRAAKIHRVHVWDDETLKYRVNELADLFTMTRMFSFPEPDEMKPHAAIAHHLAAVLSYGDHLPDKLHEAISDAVTDLTVRNEITESAEVIERALDLYAAEQEGDAGDE